MTDAALLKEAEVLSKLSDEDLYLKLTEGQLGNELFSYEGRIQEGASLFRSALKTHRSQICSFYRKHKENLPQFAAVVAGLAISLSTTAAAITLPLTPFSILVVRYGFTKLCEEVPESEQS
jgi:hypothetical protein